MSTLVETSCGIVCQVDRSTWASDTGSEISHFSSPGEALVAHSDHCESVTGALPYTVTYLVDRKVLQAMVAEAGGTELFPYSNDGWILRDDWWLPACVDPSLGDAEEATDLIAEVGDMGVHVELFKFEAIYFIRWSVADHDDSGLEVLGALDVDVALALAEGKAEELGSDHGLQIPFAIGLANLEASARFPLPGDVELAAHASTAWPYDPSVEEVVTIYRRTADGGTEWLVTSRGEQLVLGRYPTWPALRARTWAPDGWEVIFDWSIEEPDE